ncbi:MAG: hypothetical protein WCD31_09420, partial [Gillisia sp.]
QSSATSQSFGSSAVSGLNFWNLLKTHQYGASKSVNNSASTGRSVSYQEEKLVTIPAKTAKIISEYDINETLIRNCDLYLYPNRRQVGSFSYSEENSPMNFSNRLSYTVGDSAEITEVENSFYVSEITNYPEKEIIETEYQEFCGERENAPTTYFTRSAPDKFYIRYEKGNRSGKH